MQAAPQTNTSLVMPTDVQEKAKTILTQVLSQIPESTQGLERQIFIGDVVEKLPIENKTALKDYVEALLMRMFVLNASDIDVGGYGSHGKIWYRIFGSKKPDPTLEPLKIDETNMVNDLK